MSFFTKCICSSDTPPEDKIEETPENIEEIRTIKDGTYPMNNADEFIIIQQALQGE